MFIHPDGLRFILPFLVIIFVLFYCGCTYTGVFLLPIFVWVVAFFRNPIPLLPQDETLIVSPGSGKIVGITQVKPPYGISDAECTKISIFLNVFNVHVNRMPVNGTIADIIYHPGKFFNASFDKSSLENERNTLIIEYANHKMAVSQVAGLIARRIVCEVKKGDEVKRGDVFGLIRFGSRVDIYFDTIVEPLVKVGQMVDVGQTPICKIPQ